jgi:hypothetical protein
MRTLVSTLIAVSVLGLVARRQGLGKVFRSYTLWL